MCCDHNNCFSYSKQLAVQLLQAVDDGDINRIKNLLEQGVDVNHQLYWIEEWWIWGILLYTELVRRAI